MRHGHLKTLGFALAAGLVLATALPAAGIARSGRAYVTAKSNYGNGTLTAPIRRSRWGWEVRLPGGMWWDCAGDCAEALRRESLDFWETLSEERGDGHFD